MGEFLRANRAQIDSVWPPAAPAAEAALAEAPGTTQQAAPPQKAYIIVPPSEHLEYLVQSVGDKGMWQGEARDLSRAEAWLQHMQNTQAVDYGARHQQSHKAGETTRIMKCRCAGYPSWRVSPALWHAAP